MKQGLISNCLFCQLLDTVYPNQTGSTHHRRDKGTQDSWERCSWTQQVQDEPEARAAHRGGSSGQWTIAILQGMTAQAAKHLTLVDTWEGHTDLSPRLASSSRAALGKRDTCPERGCYSTRATSALAAFFLSLSTDIVALTVSVLVIERKSFYCSPFKY